MGGRIKLLPVTIAASFLLLFAKVGDLWQGTRVAVPWVFAAAAVGEAADGTRGEAEPEAHEEASAAGEKEPVDAGGMDVRHLSAAELEILQSLAARRETLETRAHDIEMRARLLEVAEARIETRIAELKNLQARVESLLQTRSAEEEANLKTLVKIYENMKPKDAARIFERLDMAILLDVVERMRGTKTATILARMDPERAKAITTRLVQRRRLPRQGG